MRLPVKWVADMHTDILVGVDLGSLAHDESPEWPVTLAAAKFPAVRIGELVQFADNDLGLVQFDSAVLVRFTTITERIIEGIPVAAAYRKKPNHPIHS